MAKPTWGGLLKGTLVGGIGGQIISIAIMKAGAPVVGSAAVFAALPVSIYASVKLFFKFATHAGWKHFFGCYFVLGPLVGPDGCRRRIIECEYPVLSTSTPRRGATDAERPSCHSTDPRTPG